MKSDRMQSKPRCEQCGHVAHHVRGSIICDECGHMVRITPVTDNPPPVSPYQPKPGT